MLGPLLYGFVSWLSETIPADEKIVFLAREGALLQRAFDIYSNRPSSYMYISRRAVGLARVAVADRPDTVSQFDVMTAPKRQTQRELATGSVYSGINKRGYLFEQNDNKKTEEGVRNSAPFFEMLFLSGEGTTVRYAEEPTGEIYPILGRPENKLAQAEIIKKTQRAGLQFVRDMVNSPLSGSLSIDADSAIGNYLALAKVPSNATLRLFRDFQTDEGRLVNQYGALYYLFHPKQFVDDFMKLHGKAWFLKSVMKLPLPYTQILKVLRGISVRL